MFGICFGGQLLALAHGGEVVKSPDPELGWVGVALRRRRPGRLRSRGSSGTTTAGPCRIGATEIARNAHASQAFVLGRNLAVQFHPEMTPDILAGWFATGGNEDIDRFGLDGPALQDQTRVCDPVNRERAHRLVDAFLDRVATGRREREAVR